MIIFNKNLVGGQTSFTHHSSSEHSISEERKSISHNKRHRKYKKLSPVNRKYLKSLGFTLKK